MAPTPPPTEIDFEALHYIPKRAVIDALRINPTQRYVLPLGSPTEMTDKSRNDS
jgi:hypothetical protein